MKFALVGDIHTSHEQIYKFKQRVKHDKIDLLLINGDFINVYHDIGEKPEDGQEFEDVLESFKELGVMILFVPGNHDPKHQFENLNSSNIHTKWVKIGRFNIFGFGGSVPGCFVGGKEAFPGYPFNSDGEFMDAFETSFNNSFNHIESIRVDSVQDNGPDYNIILAHTGPSGGTTLDTREDLLRFTGSALMAKRLIKDTSIDLYLHGHSHNNRGMVQINATTVINPGPLRDGQYCIVEIDGNDLSVSFNQL